MDFVLKYWIIGVILFVFIVLGTGASLIVWRNVIYCLIRDVLKDMLKEYKEDNYYNVKGAFKAAIKEVYRENNRG